VTPSTVALVAPAAPSRTQIAKCLRDGGFEVFACEELSIATRFLRVVLVDAVGSRRVHGWVRSWLRGTGSPRVVIISSRPAAWKALSMAHGDGVYVLAAPAFGWEIVDALRAPSLPPA
jgi:hypothetical protein